MQKLLVIFISSILFSTSLLATEVQILSATVKNKVISGAKIILQKNGETSLEGTTNAEGKAKFNEPFGGLDDSSVTMIVKKSGHSNLVVKCPCNDMAYAISPSQRSLDGMRIVLNWGKTPRDLDSHMAYPGNHVFFSKKRGDKANLDVDDTTSYGPETITIEKRYHGKKYLYAVHNYTEGDKKGTTTISSISQAKVFVYIGDSLVRTFTPPANKTGNTWVVFGIGDGGEFYDINKFSDFGNREDVGVYLKELIKKGNFESLPDINPEKIRLADTQNRKGEKAYHAKKLEKSVEYYLDAINNNPEHGQAYSNLGLSYRRMKKFAESLWANRKSIQLASGPKKKVIQASSYYNIAKVYEDQQQWNNALDNFKEALKLRQHSAYTKGIKRMKTKLGME